MVATPSIEYGAAARAKAGERAIGDRHLVESFAGGMLFAAIDGLGHGEAAAAVAAIASNTLRHDPSEPVIALVKRCHQALVGTRGVAMSVALIDTRHGVLSWLSVGNVDGVLFQSAPDGRQITSRLVTRGGVVGSALPPLRGESIGIGPGDLLIFATDGIDSRFADAFRRDRRSAQEIADQLLAEFAKPTDDALVLAARVGGN